MVKYITVFLMLCVGTSAFAQSVELDSKAPIEIAADTLEVFQDQQKAIFSGNVIAKQGNINMRAATMTVHYSNSGTDGAVGAVAKGISKIVAEGNVFFTNSRETAQGSRAIYDVPNEQISMAGNVILTRDKNILKGTQLTYNLATGKSVLSSGSTTGTGSGGRVKGLFVPGNK